MYNKGEQTVKKTVTYADGSIQQFNYHYPDDNDVVTTFKSGTLTLTSQSATDSFGRKTFEELSTGTYCLSRRYEYYDGAATAEHIANGKHKYTPTTNLVKKLTCSDGNMGLTRVNPITPYE